LADRSFAVAGRAPISSYASKPIELTAAVARRFVEDMRAFHAETNAIEADEIAARQLRALRYNITSASFDFLA
jgi:hypothetical protein